MDLSRLRVGTLLAGLVVVGGLSGIVLAQTAPAQTKQAPDDFLKGAYLKDTPGLTLPKVTYEVHPKYTADGMRNKIQGIVKVQAVVGTDGAITRARVTESLDTVMGLDDAALDAAKKWKFTPGMLKDKPVPCAVELVLEFRLH